MRFMELGRARIAQLDREKNGWCQDISNIQIISELISPELEKESNANDNLIIRGIVLTMVSFIDVFII